MNLVRLMAMILFCACVAVPGRAADDKKDDEKKERETARAVLAKAKIDLLKAIGTAQAKVPAGKPVYATTVKEDGKDLFEVFLLTGDKGTEVEINAVTGTVVEVEAGDADDIPAEAKKALAAAKITLEKALAAGSAKVPGGKAFVVEFDLEEGKAIVGMQLIAGSKIMSVVVDAVDGKVLDVQEDKE